MIPTEAQEMLDRCCKETAAAVENGYQLPLMLDLQSTVLLVATIQVALRHPRIPARTSGLAQGLLDTIIRRIRDDGFPETARMLELGNHTENDI